MLVSYNGHEPRLLRLFNEAMRLLAAHYTVHTSPMPLLPSAAATQVPGLEKGTRVEAGSLGQAASGMPNMIMYFPERFFQAALRVVCG